MPWRCWHEPQEILGVPQGILIAPTSSCRILETHQRDGVSRFDAQCNGQGVRDVLSRWHTQDHFQTSLWSRHSWTLGGDCGTLAEFPC